jgi:hypothetical protein
VREHPDRRPGTVGDRATAEVVAATFARRGFQLRRDRFHRDGTELVNVIGRRPGRSRRQIVLVAARDAASVPDTGGSAADTAALLEFARVLQGRPSRKSVVLASIDGSTLGQLGATRLADALDPELVDAVLVVSDLGASSRRGPLIVPWSNDSTRPGIGLLRTLADSLRQELAEPVGGTGTLGQLARLSFPLGIGDQGVLLERGFDAVRISGSGELPPGGHRGQELDPRRLGGLGRATLRTVTALDPGPPPAHGPSSYVIAVSKVLPGWIFSLLALTLIVPALVAAVDAFARARRRRHPVAPWLRWLVVSVAPFALGLVFAELLTLAGATPDPPPAPVPPHDYAFDATAAVVLAGVGLLVVAAWVVGRFLLLRADPAVHDPREPGAACVTALVLTVTVLLWWALSPYAALLALPAVHLWMLAMLGDPLPSRRGRLLLVAGGLLPAVGVAAYYLLSLSMSPPAGAWYLFLLVTGHTVGLATALIGCLLLGTLGAVLAIVLLPDGEPPPRAEPRRVYGPGAYAGPGSLGGTESALRR